MKIISPIYIATITPSNIKHAMGGLVSFVNFRGPHDNSFGNTKKIKKFFLHKIFNILSFLPISSLNNIVYTGHVTM